MSHIIYRAVLSSEPVIDITAQEYSNVVQARDGLNEVISAEEKFDVLMENYVELEGTLLSIAVRDVAFSNYEYNHILSLRTLISRRMSNLLSSARLYRDAYRQTLKRTLGNQNQETSRLSALLLDADAQPMAFKIIEAVRNYAQHQELPVSKISLSRSRVDSRVAFCVIPYIDASEVSRGRDIKPDIRAALELLGDKANPMDHLREYVEHIGEAHERFRSAVKAQMEIWEKTIIGMIERYKILHPENKDTVLAVGVRTGKDTISGSVHLVRESIQYRKFLHDKNRSSANLSKRFVQW